MPTDYSQLDGRARDNLHDAHGSEARSQIRLTIDGRRNQSAEAVNQQTALQIIRTFAPQIAAFTFTGNPICGLVPSASKAPCNSRGQTLTLFALNPTDSPPRPANGRQPSSSLQIQKAWAKNWAKGCVAIRDSGFSGGGWKTQDHAATPKSVWMNWRCPTTSPLGSQRICPFRIRCIAS